MAVSVDQLVRELRSFDGRREVVKAVGRGVRKGAPAVRKAIRAKALEILPSGGGLGKWVAQSRVTVQVRLSGRKAGVKLKGGRNSAGQRSDIKAIDNGRVRAPSWGRRGKGAWHVQAVPEGFFTETAAQATEWHDEVEAAVDEALNQIRRG
jgi:hypothetical protein